MRLSIATQIISKMIEQQPGINKRKVKHEHELSKEEKAEFLIAWIAQIVNDC